MRRPVAALLLLTLIAVAAVIAHLLLFAALVLAGSAAVILVAYRRADAARVARRQALARSALADGAVAAAEADRVHPIRVVYLDHCAELSGGEIALARLIDAMKGVDPHVILAEDGPLRGRLEQQGVPVEVVRMKEEARSTTRLQVSPGLTAVRLVGQVVGYAWVLRGRLKQLKPQLVHTNSLKSAVYGSLAGRLAGVPVVCHLRDRLAADYMSGPAVWMMRGVLRVLPQAVIANSLATMSTLAPSTSAVRISGAVAYDPLPAGIATADPERSAPFTVGMVGRISSWKGQDVFLEAFARAFPAAGALAVIVGSPMFGETAYATRLEALIDRLGIRDRVEMVGFDPEVRGRLAHFDVLVHASVIPEPFGQVVVEGMAAGLPVVASDAGGPSEVITSGVNGILYPPGDVEALARVLVALRDSPATRRSLGEAARIKAEEFRPERVARKVTAVYAALVS